MDHTRQRHQSDYSLLVTTHLSTPRGWKAELTELADLQRTIYPYESAAAQVQARESPLVDRRSSTELPYTVKF